MNSWEGGAEGYHVLCVNETSVKGVISGSDLSFCSQPSSRRQEEGDNTPSLRKQKTHGHVNVAYVGKSHAVQTPAE